MHPCGAPNFCLTGLGVTGHGKGSLKLKKIPNWPQKMFDALNFSTYRMQITRHTVFIEIEKSYYFVENCHFS